MPCISRTEDAAFVRLTPGGERAAVPRALAAELRVAVEVNGIGYAVMMAPPDDLVAFTRGPAG